MKCKIGNVEIKNQVVLAPMAGISNPTYIKICEDMGVGYAVTELISAEAITRGNKKTFTMLYGLDKISIPVAVQLFGSNPNKMAMAAKKLVEDYNVKIIDINMGCPVVKVAIKNEAGSALLKNPKRVYEIVSKVVDAVDVPVTVKIRSGWDSESINAVEIAKTVEKAGASAITVHPRTRAQGYTGKANWDIIKQVKENVSIPVIGNGDILSCYDAKRMLDVTGCDAVMIGRGVLGNPWLIKECIDYLEKGIEPSLVSKEERINMIKKHAELLIKNKPEKVAMLEMRTHAAYYIKGLPGSATMKNEIFKMTTKEDLFNLLDNYMKSLNN